ncbi:MAG TPA: hypothetical protein VMX74_14920 [Pirellulales bacterium]|nr:hypothetical protein [Pirellulales bacterium]
MQRLLSEAYRPELPDADFVGRVQEAMRDAAQRRQAASSDTRPALISGARLKPGSLSEMVATVAITLGFVVGLVALLMIERAGQNRRSPNDAGCT